MILPNLINAPKIMNLTTKIRILVLIHQCMIMIITHFRNGQQILAITTKKRICLKIYKSIL